MRRWLSIFAKRLFWIAVPALFLRACALEVVRVTDSTMHPIANPGDLIFVSKLAYGLRIPGIGAYTLRWNKVDKEQLVVITDVGEPPQTLLRRVVALPKEAYTFSGQMEAQITKSNEYFVLANTAERAPDSRSLGAVPLRSIIGRAKYIWRADRSKVESLP